MAAFIIGLGVTLWHCFTFGDIYRVINGYDSCANVCGRITPTETNTEFRCKGADMKKNKYLLIKEASRAIVNPRNVFKECVMSCDVYPGFQEFLNRCIPKQGVEVVNQFFSKTGLNDFFLEVTEDIHLCWPEILYSCLIAFVLSLIVLFLLRYVVGFVIWVVLIGTVIASLGTTIYLWVSWKEKMKIKHESYSSQNEVNTYLGYAIVATVVTVIIFLVIFVMRKRVRLVMQLFTEAGKALSSMPLLLFLPILTFIVLGISFGLWLYFSLWIESSGHLTKSSPSFYYEKDTTMKVARWYNFLALLWFVQFCIGCQHMVIAGSVATWYFVRDKRNVDSPIENSFRYLTRYHLGSVALGSFLIALLQFLRSMLMAIQKALKDPEHELTKLCNKCCQCCLLCFEKILVYISRNAYIEIAIYGENFSGGAQRALKMLATNALRVAAINSVGDFVLFLGKVLVVVVTLLLCIIMLDNKEGILHMWIPLTLVGIFAYLVSHCFITVYEMVIDTIFLCFCEDCEINDGVNKPYFMNQGLMVSMKHFHPQ
ncbi:hypothetical protein AAG570_013348 [Ranatra chinensis]|uniref:Choline transporter-like protein n=1 Tax=Ranatra chinensis TaxID=642074 RepID=A0ABD0YCK8_9HEMI